MAEISVIMLVHNREKYVGQAVESILNQTFRDFEFIIVDNASTDNSMDIVREYQKKDSRIIIYESKTENIGAGRNLGLKKAAGKYFTFVDDDDYCLPNYLDFLWHLAEEWGGDLAVCGSCYDVQGEIKPKFVFDELLLYDKKEAMTDFLLREHFNNGNATKLFRRTEEISNVHYKENCKYDDIHTMYRFFMELGEREHVVAAKGEPLFFSRKHESNNSSATLKFQNLTPDWLDEYADAYRERTEYISRRMPELGPLARYSEWSWMISMVEKINRFSLDNCSAWLAEAEEILRKNRDEFLTTAWIKEFEKEWMEEYI